MKRPTAFCLVSTFFPALAVILTSAPLIHAHDGESHPVILGVDQNHNLLSDLYESLYPGLTDASADNDHDGETNGQENAAGTNPLSPMDRLDFSIVESTIAGINTVWPTQAGKQYQLQTNTSLGPDWIDEGPPLMGTGAPLSCLCPRIGSIQRVGCGGTK